MSGDENFLRRWSRLKTEQRQEVSPPSSGNEEAVVDAGESARDTKPLGEEPKAALELPPIDSLGKDSDFTVFMREGVPEALKQQALRKLWASDPAFGAPDILDIHALDYSHLGRTQEVVRTAYQIGKGFIDEVEKAVDAIETEADRLPGSAAPAKAEDGKVDSAKVGAGKPAS
jgi:hypothetical protein